MTLKETLAQHMFVKFHTNRLKSASSIVLTKSVIYHIYHPPETASEKIKYKILKMSIVRNINSSFGYKNMYAAYKILKSI